MPSINSEQNILCETDFPPYCVASVDGNIAIIAGGGGTAKTGVGNKFEIYSLHQNKDRTSARLVFSHDVGDHCISNMAVWKLPSNPNALKDSLKKAPEYFKKQVDKKLIAGRSEICLAASDEEKCTIYKITPRLVRQEMNGNCNKESDSNGSAAINRNASNQHNEALTKREKTTKTAGITYSIDKICSFQTVFRSGENSSEEIYQKTCKVSPDNNLLITAGTDGKIRVWDISSLPSPTPSNVRTINAHTKEVDFLDISLDCKHVVSVCKSTRECIVWDIKTGKKITQLALDIPGLKYKFSWARFSCAEGKIEELRLFAISNPVVGSKNPAIVSKWCGKQYSLSKMQKLEGVLSNISVSDDGKFLAMGTMEGDVIILIAFSLQPLKRLVSAHSVFVTGLAWLEDGTRKSCVARGFSEASVLSVSCDNTLQIIHIPRAKEIPLWLAVILCIFSLLCAFFIASYLEV